MIKFLCVKKGPVSRYLERWGKPLRDELVHQKYDSFFRQHRSFLRRSLRISYREQRLYSTYIFSDLERLEPEELETLSAIWLQLQGSWPSIRLLNDPSRVLKRLPLLNKLHLEGVNSFDAHPIVPGQIPKPHRFPVFIREADDHCGPTSDLIFSQEELERNIAEMRRAGEPGKNPIVTEWISTKDAHGQYKKYAAFRIGEEIIPAHILASRYWLVKGSRSIVPSEEEAADELRYLQTNPHREELLAIFEMAHVDYGRIDYGFHEGRLQVFEINTNPVLLKASEPQLVRRKCKQFVAERLLAAFEDLVKGEVLP
jgi:hypothetical protein